MMTSWSTYYVVINNTLESCIKNKGYNHCFLCQNFGYTAPYVLYSLIESNVLLSSYFYVSEITRLLDAEVAELTQSCGGTIN